MDISMDIPMDIHEKICGYGYGYGWEISYPRYAASINVVYRHPVSTWMGNRLRAGKPSRYVTSQLGQLSLSSLLGR